MCTLQVTGKPRAKESPLCCRLVVALGPLFIDGVIFVHGVSWVDTVAIVAEM